MILVSGLFTMAFRICESAFPRKCSPRPKAVVTINASVRRSIFSGPWGDIAFSENVGSLGTFWEKNGEHFEKHWEKLRNIGVKHRKNGEHVGNMLETCWKQGWELWNTYQSWYVWWLSTAHSNDIETAFVCCFSRIFNQSHRGTTRIGIPNWTIFGSDPPDLNHHLWSLVGWGSHLPKQIFGQM